MPGELLADRSAEEFAAVGVQSVNSLINEANKFIGEVGTEEPARVLLNCASWAFGGCAFHAGIKTILTQLNTQSIKCCNEALLFNFSVMANSPREGQQFVGFKLDEKLLGLVDKARGFADRSLFFRQAIAEKLKGLGVTVSDDLVFPPDRVRLHCLNDEPSAVPTPPRKDVKYPTPPTKRGRKKS